MPDSHAIREKPQGEKGEQRGVNQKMNEIRRMFRVWIVFRLTLAIRDTQTPDSALTCEWGEARGNKATGSGKQNQGFRVSCSQ